MDNYESTDVATSPNTFRRKPVFMIERFDQGNMDHLKGYLTAKFNRTMAVELIKLIDSIELSPDEGFMYAFRAQMSNWLNIRKEILLRLAEDGNDFEGGNDDEYENTDDR